MDQNLTLDLLVDLIASELRVDRSGLSPESGPSSIHSWDSMANTLIFLAIESRFNCVSISFDEFLACENISDLYRMLRDKLQ